MGVYKLLLVIDPEVCKRGARMEDGRVGLALVGRTSGLLVAAGGKPFGEFRSFRHATTTSSSPDRQASSDVVDL